MAVENTVFLLFFMLSSTFRRKDRKNVFGKKIMKINKLFSEMEYDNKVKI